MNFIEVFFMKQSLVFGENKLFGTKMHFSKFQHFGSNHRIKNKVIHLKSYVDKTQIDYEMLILKEYSAHEINAKTW